MQKLELSQNMNQKLSPQQIQFIKLLQIPTAELNSRVEEEIECNPALEEGEEEDPNARDSEEEVVDDYDDKIEKEEEINLEEYLQDDFSGYKMHGDGASNEEDKEMPVATSESLNDQLMTQLGYLKLNEKQHIIAEQLIGSIEADGYIRRELEAIANDLLFAQGIETDTEELESVLNKIHNFEPAGIGARNLQECLLLQLKRKTKKSEDLKLAIRIIETCYNDFTKKHFEKIMRRLGMKTEDDLKGPMDVIIKLNPKPGSSSEGLVKTQFLIPDFLLNNVNGKLELRLNSKNAPELKINRSYSELMDTYDKSKKRDKKLRETVSFVKQKLDSAKWFIDAIRQRQQTLLNTMNTIIEYQYEFFLDGDESKLRPMILKNIANKIHMDISTVSRVANSKSIQTEFGIYPLKFFFSEGIATDSGEDVSSREVKYSLKVIIEKENKRKPLSDDKLEKMLKAKGYNIARRTVAKYREQLNIPVARLRKQL